MAYTTVADPVMAGADISYKCTATPGVYEITLVVYRNCISPVSVSLCPDNGCAGPCSQTIQLRGADPSCNNNLLSTITLNLVSVRDVNINPDCPGYKSICQNRRCVLAGIIVPGVERYEFKGFANLGATSGIPVTCCNVRLSWLAPSPIIRSSALNTISLNPASNAGFYIEAVINRCVSVSPCNGAPEFTNEPVASICGGQPFVYNNGATDPDFDSLSYAFVPGLSSATSTLVYIPPYTFDKPMPWTGSATGVFPAGIRCDAVTGDIMFTPGNTSGQNFYGVVVVEIKQWKTINGVPTLMGTTRRDIQMIVLGNCPSNNPPRLLTNPPNSSNANTPRTNWEVCAGEKLCFTVTAKDTDFSPPSISDTTKLSWNAALASLGATFQPVYTHSQTQRRTLGPREDTWEFCWTPTQAMSNSLPYYFTVSAKDSRCPDPGRITRSFSVKVLPKAEVRMRKLDLRCGNYKVWYERDTLAKGGRPSLPYTSTTWVIARVPEDWQLDQNPYVFTNTATPPNLAFPRGGRYLAELRITTPGPAGEPHCLQVFKDTLLVDTLVEPVLSDTFTCTGSSVQLQAFARYGNPSYAFRWYNSITDTNNAPLNAPNFNTAPFTVSPSSNRYYTLQVRDVNGCRSYDSLYVSVKPLPTSSLIDSMRICFGDKFTFSAGNNGGNVRSYLWSSGDTAQSITRGDSGRFTVLLTDTFGCQKQDTAMLYVNRRITANAGNDIQLCAGDSIQLQPTGGQFYQWFDINTQSTLLPKQRDGRFWVKPTNTSIAARYQLTAYASYPDTINQYKECANSDTIQVIVNALPALARPLATLVCRSTPLVLLPNFAITNGMGGGTGIWSYAPSPAAITSTGNQLVVDSLQNNPRKDTNTLNSFVNWVRYAYTSPSSFGGCTRVDSAQIILYANPKVNAGTRLRWCNNAGNYTITGNRVYSPVATATGGDMEEWSGNGIVLTATTPLRRYSFNPTAAGVIVGANIISYKYTRNYNNQINCQSEDTVLFEVTVPPVIAAGNNLAICQNDVMLNIASQSGATITPATNGGFWRIATPASADVAIVNARQELNPKSVVIPNNAASLMLKTVYTDTSSGCTVRDTIDIEVNRNPEVDLLYDMPQADSIYVCQQSKLVYFRAFNVLPNNSRIEITANSSNSTLQGSQAFELNPNLAVNTSRLVFNSQNETPGLYRLVYTYTDESTTANCRSSDSTLLYVLQAPSVGIASANALCSNDSVLQVSVQQLQPADMPFRWIPITDGSYANDTGQATIYVPGTTDIQNGFMDVQLISQKRTGALLPARNANGTIIVGNGDVCVADSERLRVFIKPSPVATVLATNPTGCEPLTSIFSAAPTGVSDARFRWEWEGNSRPPKTDSSIMEIQQQYDAQTSGVYKTRLIVSTASTPVCYDTSAWQSMRVFALPKASFVVDPYNKITTVGNPFFSFYNTSVSMDGSSLRFWWNLGPGPGVRISEAVDQPNVEYESDTARQEIWLTAITENGCIDSTRDYVTINPDISVYIPSAFSPASSVECAGGDEECNRTFKVMADGYQQIEVRIYNRWGQQVFYTTDANEGWQGKMRMGDENDKGEVCPQDAYSYQVNAISFNGKKYVYTGSVTLLR